MLILLFKSTVYVLHILFYCTFYSLFFLIFIFYLYLCLSSCVVSHILHCPLSGPDLTYISLLIIFCIIEYVTNKTLIIEDFLTLKGIVNPIFKMYSPKPVFFLLLNTEDVCKNVGNQTIDGRH